MGELPVRRCRCHRRHDLEIQVAASLVGGPARSEKPEGGLGGADPRLGGFGFRVSGYGLGTTLWVRVWDWVLGLGSARPPVLELCGLGFGVGCHEGIKAGSGIRCMVGEILPRYQVIKSCGLPVFPGYQVIKSCGLPVFPRSQVVKSYGFQVFPRSVSKLTVQSICICLPDDPEISG